MATISITVPDALVPRLTAAMRATYPQYSGLTDVQTFKKVTADMWRVLVSFYEGGLAEQAAANQANTDLSGMG